MKHRFLIVVVGLAICLGRSALAQQKVTVGSGITQQRDLLSDSKAVDEFGDVCAVLGAKEDEAFNKKDSAAVAALFTEDAVLVAPDGMFSARQAIKKRYADTFQRDPSATFTASRRQLNAIDNAVWSVGEWWNNLQSRPVPFSSEATGPLSMFVRVMLGGFAC
jgi:type IV secretory pathway TrbF-like protein